MTDLFSVEIQNIAQHPVLRLAGELTAEGESRLTAAFESLIQASPEQVVFDFSEVKYINSGGISILLNLISRSRFEGKKILFAGLTRHLRKVVEIVGMDEFVQIVDRLD